MPGKKVVQYSPGPVVCLTKDKINKPAPAVAGPTISNSLGPCFIRNTTGEARNGDHQYRERQKCQTGLQLAVALYLHQIER